MDSGVHWLKRGGKTPLHIALSAIALAVGVGAMLFLRKNGEKSIDSAKEPVVRSVSLINRTITAASKEGSVGIILRVSFKETVLGVERLPRIGV